MPSDETRTHLLSFWVGLFLVVSAVVVTQVCVGFESLALRENVADYLWRVLVVSAALAAIGILLIRRSGRTYHWRFWVGTLLYTVGLTNIPVLLVFAGESTSLSTTVEGVITGSSTTPLIIVGIICVWGSRPRIGIRLSLTEMAKSLVSVSLGCLLGCLVGILLTPAVIEIGL